MSANDSPQTTTYVQKNDSKQSSSTKVEYSYGVNFSVQTGGDFFGLFKATLKVSDTFKWTNTSATGSSKESSQSATVAVAGPSFGYQGPVDVEVYWDKLFRTYLFAFLDAKAVSSGHVKDQRGHPVIGKEVVLTSGGNTYRTFTDLKGDFRFYGPVAGASTVLVGDKTVNLPHPTIGITLEI